MQHLLRFEEETTTGRDKTARWPTFLLNSGAFDDVEGKSLYFLRNFNVFDKKVKETIEKTDKTDQN